MRPGADSPDFSEVTVVQWDERVRLFRDSFWNIASLIVSGVVGLILVPIMFRGLGTERYGLWLAACSIVDIAGGLGFGLGLSLIREVAASKKGSETEECESLVATSRVIYLALGIAVLIAMALIAGLFARGLHLSAGTRALVRPVFVLAGVAFVAEELSAFALAVLAGLRRFDLIGITAILSTIANAVVTFELLRTGHSILSIAFLRAGIAVAGAAGTSVVLFLVRPALGRWKARLDVHFLRKQAGFIVASQANTLIGKAVFDGITPLIGFVLGAAAIVPYRIGLKFPQFLAMASGRVAEVLYPASSEYEAGDHRHKLRDALQWSTRILMFFNLPVLAVLFALAPRLIHVWIPAAPSEAVAVLRVYVFAAFFDALGYAADNLLWGMGRAKALLKILLLSGAVTLGIGIVCMLHFGIVGMAIGISAGFLVGTAQLLALSCRAFEMQLRTLGRFVFHGLIIPTALCVLSVWAICRVSVPKHLYSVAVIAGLGLAVYLGSHFAMGSSHNEREMLLRLFRRGSVNDEAASRST